MLGDPAMDGAHGLDREAVEPPRVVGADALQQAAGTQRIAGADEAAVAAGRAPADAPRLEQHDAAAALGEFQREVEPGQAAANDAGIGADDPESAGQRRSSARVRA